MCLGAEKSGVAQRISHNNDSIDNISLNVVEYVFTG